MREVVVLVHGIWSFGAELSLLQRRIARCGFDCRLFRYRSLLRSPRENAARLSAYLRALDAPIIHLLGHSLGGIVLLHLFNDFPEQKPGRVVLLAVPCNGSAAAAALSRSPLTRWLLGRAAEGGLLGDAPRWPRTRAAASIAGSRGIGMGKIVTLGRLERPNDGTVRLAETRAAEIDLHLEVPYSHFGLLFAAPVAAAVCRFLLTGRLDAQVDEESDPSG